VLQPRVGSALAPYFPPIDLLLGLFFLFSLIGLRLAVFRSWMFLHKERNVGRLERMIATLDNADEGKRPA
jgi:hypothetical protein